MMPQDSPTLVFTGGIMLSFVLSFRARERKEERNDGDEEQVNSRQSYILLWAAVSTSSYHFSSY